MKKIKIRNERLLFVILIIVLFFTCILLYHFVFSNIFERNSFSNEMIEIANENENSIFNIQRILLYSSANATSNSENQSLQDMNISQYTDISIYIDNTSTISELTNENTVKQLYIDDISITTKSDIGNKLLNYKSPLDFGKYKNLKEAKDNRIDFNIVNTNEQNENNDYSNPTFYTDCSNPISLGYLNKDIVKNYSISENSSSVSFNGKVLQEANVNINDINYSLSFKIHIINNLNQKFLYNMKLDVGLNDDNGGGIYNGYVYMEKDTSGNEYRFFKEI